MMIVIYNWFECWEIWEILTFVMEDQEDQTITKIRFPVIHKCSCKRKRSLGKIGNLHHEEQQQQADAGCFENEKVTTTNCNILTKALIYN